MVPKSTPLPGVSKFRNCVAHGIVVVAVALVDVVAAFVDCVVGPVIGFVVELVGVVVDDTLSMDLELVLAVVMGC